MPLHSGKIRQNAQKYLFLQEIINSKTKNMKMNYVKMRWFVLSSMGHPCRD